MLVAEAVREIYRVLRAEAAAVSEVSVVTAATCDS
jgi:hypothetical protein